MSVRYDTSDGVAVITLDDAANRNAINSAFLNALGDSLTRAISDSDARAILITHNGPVFCAGADLKGQGSELPRFGLADVLALMRDAVKPVFAVVRGPAMGGGVGLAAAADISYASTDATFGFTEVRLGVAPAVISVVCIPKMRPSDAADLFLRGNKISAQRAADVGLINAAVEPDSLDAAVQALLDDLLAGGPNALASAKELLRGVPTMSRDDAFTWTAALSAQLFASAEATEGIAAFRERRPAAWARRD